MTEYLLTKQTDIHDGGLGSWKLGALSFLQWEQQASTYNKASKENLNFGKRVLNGNEYFFRKVPYHQKKTRGKKNHSNIIESTTLDFDTKGFRNETY